MYYMSAQSTAAVTTNFTMLPGVDIVAIHLACHCTLLTGTAASLAPGSGNILWQKQPLILA